MSTQVDQAIVEAAHGVHSKVWQDHWKKGKVQLRSSEVTEYIRTVRVNAACNEDQLPGPLLQLLATARNERFEVIELHKLLAALKSIVLAAA